MKAIKINVEKQEVSIIEIGNDLQDIYNAIGNDCSCITAPISYENDDVMFCDDESLLRPSTIKGGFMYPDWNYPIVSNAIILGTDENGNSVDCESTLEEIKNGIRFISIENTNLQRYINQFA
jgi:hypothetical protein